MVYLTVSTSRATNELLSLAMVYSTPRATKVLPFYHQYIVKWLNYKVKQAKNK